MTESHDTIRAIAWREGALHLLDQRIIPQREEYVVCDSAPQVADAIRAMVVRGAPAIGIAAAYGVVLSAASASIRNADGWRESVAAELAMLAQARPTAVNLGWALDRMADRLSTIDGEEDPVGVLLGEAQAIENEDVAANHRMGRLGADLIESTGSAVLTHCNTGSLATGGFGTALGVIRQAYIDGRISGVFADETRPWLQGARLTAWELVKDRIPVTLIADSAAAARLAQGGISWVIVGSDRIAANGDVANKIGTYSLAIAAKYHGVRFMVVAPTSTVDMAVASGTDIPIETRGSEELLHCGGTAVAAQGADAWNPVFDVTPASLVDAIVTEKGVVMAPTREKMAAMMNS